MKRPAFQFYPGDWQRNANLRRCSPAARGVWVDVMCLMHDSDEYGVLRWPLKEIAQAAGASMSHVRELVDKSVLKGSDKQLSEPFVYVPRSGRKEGDPVTLLDTQAGPIWYSSRMVKDEYVRTIRGESSRFGEASKDAPKPPFGDGSTSASATAVSTSPYGDGGQSADADVADPCPHQAIIDLYHQHLPTGRQVREWTPARAQALRARWREKPKRQNLDWWGKFFAYCAESDFLTGKVHTPGRKPFELSLDWLVKAENMAKVIEGAYENEREAA